MSSEKNTVILLYASLELDVIAYISVLELSQ